jgi:Ca2+-binding EF-hand superfamily protein
MLTLLSVHVSHLMFPSLQNVSQLFRIFDKNHSGSIDFEEFVLTADKLVRGSDMNRLGFFFLVADNDASGTLERSEVVSMLIILNRIAKKPIGVQDVVSDIFADADADKNGHIDKKELLAWIKSESKSTKPVLGLMREFGHKFMGA